MVTPHIPKIAPPSENKLALIRRFMSSTGLQSKLNSGSFLRRYTFIHDLGWTQSLGTTLVSESIYERAQGRLDALTNVYEKYRHAYQEAYEFQIDQEFTEEELQGMLNFLESPLGQHYVEGSKRMELYTGTAVQDSEDALVAEAVENYRNR